MQPKKSIINPFITHNKGTKTAKEVGLMSRKKKARRAKERLKLRPVDIETAGEYATIDDLKKQAGIKNDNKIP
jgi:hypothetical protein